MPAAPSVPVPARAVRHLRRAVALLLVVLSCSAALAQPAAAAPPVAARYALTAAQERVVLRLVDDLCGDTWCEGDHAFRFTSFTCHSRRGCLLRARLASWSHEPPRWYARSGRVVGFHRFGDMVETGAGGDRSLRPAFADAVGWAVRRMADSVP